MSDKNTIDIQKYLDNRMLTLEKNNFEKRLHEEEDLLEDFSEMEDVFNFLEGYEPISPSPDFSKNLMDKIDIKERSVFNLHRLYAKSCIAAGISFILFDITNIWQNFYQMSVHLFSLFSL